MRGISINPQDREPDLASRTFRDARNANDLSARNAISMIQKMARISCEHNFYDYACSMSSRACALKDAERIELRDASV